MAGGAGVDHRSPDVKKNRCDKNRAANRCANNAALIYIAAALCYLPHLEKSISSDERI